MVCGDSSFPQNIISVLSLLNENPRVLDKSVSVCRIVFVSFLDVAMKAMSSM